MYLNQFYFIFYPKEYRITTVQTTQWQPPQHHPPHNLPRLLRHPIQSLPTIPTPDAHDLCGRPLGFIDLPPLYSIYFQHLYTSARRGKGMMVESIRSIKNR